MNRTQQKPKVFVFLNEDQPEVVSDVDLDIYLVENPEEDPVSRIINYDYSEAILTEPDVEVNRDETTDFHRKLIRQPIRFLDMDWEDAKKMLGIQPHDLVFNPESLRKASGRVYMIDTKPDEIVYEVENRSERAEGLGFLNTLARWSDYEEERVFIAYEAEEGE